MDKDSRYILNDLTDVVEELAKIVREVNPGANWAFIDFLFGARRSSVGRSPSSCATTLLTEKRG